MTPDLADALVPLSWAEAQIPVFRERFTAWQRSRPYELVLEPNPNAPEIQFLVAWRRKPLDPLMIGDACAIIASVRSALDILWVLVLRRRGIEAGRDAGFPVKRTAADFEAAAEALKVKHGGNAAEVAAVKRAKAYKGGDDVLYPLHQLCAQPRHHRLLVVRPAIDTAQIARIEGAFLYPTPLTGQDKSILAGVPVWARFRPTYANVGLTSEVFLDEPGFLKAGKPAVLMLDAFVSTVRGIIENFP